MRFGNIAAEKRTATLQVAQRVCFLHRVRES
jgi:hypothetical protein